MSSKQECPICKKKIDMDSLKKEWDPRGRVAKCPKCGGKILFTRQARTLVDDGTGTLKKRFKRA